MPLKARKSNVAFIFLLVPFSAGMLGNNVGKKIDGKVVVNNLLEFYVQKNAPIPPKTSKEAKRAEWRKKGVFVAADDNDFEPTIFEKPAVAQRPAKIKSEAKPLKWKKMKKKPGSTEESAEQKGDPGKKGAPAVESTTTLTPQVVKSDTTDESTDSTKPLRKKKKRRRATVKNSSPSQSNKASPDPEANVQKSDPKLETEPPSEPAANEPPTTNDQPVVNDQPVTNEQSVANEPEVSTAKDESPKAGQHLSQESERKDTPPAMSPASDRPTVSAEKIDNAGVAVPSMSAEESTRSAEKKTSSDTQLRSSARSSFTYRGPVTVDVAEPNEKKDAFDKLDDDTEFCKLLEMEKFKCDKENKQTVNAARRILRHALKDKAFDKCLTKNESQILVEFFAGKRPYDDQVLSTMDKALDSIIDNIKANNLNISDEMKQLIEKRTALKAAMFEVIVTSPQFIPKSWAKKYDEMLSEALKETNGINWYRVLLCYPPQKSFEDGPEDQYGNFTRKKRHWLLGCFMGPYDSKAFEETQREAQCRGQFLDTKLIEQAKKADDTSSISSPLTAFSRETAFSPCNKDSNPTLRLKREDKDSSKPVSRSPSLL